MSETMTSASRKRVAFTKVIISIVLVFFCLSMTTPAQAYDLTYIQCSIDTTTWEILSGVVTENVPLTSHSPEVRRVESSVLKNMAEESKLWNGRSTMEAFAGLEEHVKEREKEVDKGNAVGGAFNAGEEYRVLTFPGETHYKDGSTTADYNRAITINNALIYDLNAAFSVYVENTPGIQKVDDASAFYNAMKSFLTSGVLKIDTTNGYATFKEPEKYSDARYRWRMDKGYTEGKYGLKKVDKDTEYINWQMLIYEAFNNYSLAENEAVTVENVYSAKPKQMELSVAALLGSFLDGLRNVLGMWTIDDLMFNTNSREQGYVGGIFPKSWEPTIWGLFIVMEVVAALILMYGVITNIFKKALSTMNTISRVQVMQQVQDIIICALSLALLPLVLRIVISLSADFTSMVYELVPTVDDEGNKKHIYAMVARYGSTSGTLAGVVSQFMFFGAQVYFNFFYALRSLTVAVLIIIAPIMIALIAVSDSKKQATITWAKELLANILIQPMHAFVMMVILLLPGSSHGFDNLIAIYALIPFTAMMRSLFFGNSGSWGDQIAQRARQKVTGALSVGALSAAGTVALGAKNGLSNHWAERHPDTAAGTGTAGKSGGGERNNPQPPPDVKPGIPVVDSEGNPDIVPDPEEGFTPTQASSTMPQASSNLKNYDFRKGGMANLKLAAADKLKSFTDNTAIGQKLSELQEKEGSALNELGENHPIAGGFANSLAAVPGYALAAAKGATKTLPAAGFTAIGGALSGAGIGGYGAMVITSMGMNMANRQRSYSRAPEGTEAMDVQGGDGTAASAPRGAHSQPLLPNTMGGENSAFSNRGEVLDEDTGEIAQRYEASASQLNASGITDVEATSKGRSISFTADPARSTEGADLANYARTLQGLDPDARKDLINQTGISATMLDDGRVAATINRDSFAKAHDGAELTTNSEFLNGRRAYGMRIQGPMGASHSLVGGIRPNNGIPEAQVQTVVPAVSTGDSPAGAVQRVSSGGLSQEQRTILNQEIAGRESGAGYQSVMNGVSHIEKMSDGDYQITREIGAADQPLWTAGEVPTVSVETVRPEISQNTSVGAIQEVRTADLSAPQVEMLETAYVEQEDATRTGNVYASRIEGVDHISKTESGYRVHRSPQSSSRALQERPHSYSAAAANPERFRGGRAVTYQETAGRRKPAASEPASGGQREDRQPRTFTLTDLDDVNYDVPQ